MERVCFVVCVFSLFLCTYSQSRMEERWQLLSANSCTRFLAALLLLLTSVNFVTLLFHGPVVWNGLSRGLRSHITLELFRVA